MPLYSTLQEELELGNSSSLNGKFSFLTLPLSMIQMAQETVYKYGSSFIHKRKCKYKVRHKKWKRAAERDGLVRERESKTIWPIIFECYFLNCIKTTFLDNLSKRKSILLSNKYSLYLLNMIEWFSLLHVFLNMLGFILKHHAVFPKLLNLAILF